jgi:hypothetical protein
MTRQASLLRERAVSCLRAETDLRNAIDHRQFEVFSGFYFSRPVDAAAADALIAADPWRERPNAREGALRYTHAG